MLVHGLQVLIQTAAGAGSFPSEVRESLLELIEVSGKMLKPVYREDTLYPELIVSNLISQKFLLSELNLIPEFGSAGLKVAVLFTPVCKPMPLILISFFTVH